MGEPLYKIDHDKKDQQLTPFRPFRNIDQCQALCGQAQIKEECFNYFIHPADNDREKEEIEEHVKPIQPKITSYDGLTLSPRK